MEPSAVHYLHTDVRDKSSEMHNWTALCKHTAHSNANALTDEYNRIKIVEWLLCPQVCAYACWCCCSCCLLFGIVFVQSRASSPSIDGNVRFRCTSTRETQMHKQRSETNRPIHQKRLSRAHSVANVQRLRRPRVVHQTIHCWSSTKIRLRFDAPSLAEIHTYSREKARYSVRLQFEDADNSFRYVHSTWPNRVYNARAHKAAPIRTLEHSLFWFNEPHFQYIQEHWQATVAEDSHQFTTTVFSCSNRKIYWLPMQFNSMRISNQQNAPFSILTAVSWPNKAAYSNRWIIRFG